MLSEYFFKVTIKTASNIKHPAPFLLDKYKNFI